MVGSSSSTSWILKNGISWAHYPPKGTRGVGYSRANLFGKHFETYSEKQGQKILIVAQIENIQAIENIDNILKVEGLDAILIGPYDLSGSMNLTGRFDHPQFIKSLKINQNSFQWISQQ